MRKERGSVFVLTLGIMVGLVALVVSIAATERLAIRAQINREESSRARIAAEAGVARAVAALADIQAMTPTTLQDDWATLGNHGSDRFVVGAVTYRMEIVDASSRLNLNTADEATLQKLPVTQEQIDSLLDWREAGQSARSEGGKDQYYNSLPEPYNTKLRRFDTVDELLQVKGFTAQQLYFYNNNVNTVGTTTTTTTAQNPMPLSALMVVDSYSDQNVSANQQKLNVNTASQQALSQRLTGFTPPQIQLIFAGRPYTHIGDVCARVGNNTTQWRTILDNLTVTAGARVEGKINLNTAPDQVLNALPGITTDITSAIITRQSTGFTNLSDMLAIPGLNNINTIRQVADYFTTRSQSFIVRTLGTAGSTSVALETLIVIENNQPRILRMTLCPLDDPITYWGWNTDTTNDVVLKEAS